MPTQSQAPHIDRFSLLIFYRLILNPLKSYEKCSKKKHIEDYFESHLVYFKFPENQELLQMRCGNPFYASDAVNVDNFHGCQCVNTGIPEIK